MSSIAILNKSVTLEQKSTYVQSMFDSIAGRYDLLNTLLSLGIHKHWREFAIRCAAVSNGDSVLDGCAGTGELSAVARQRVGASGQIVPVDFSLQMLQAGSVRYKAAHCEPLQVDVLHLPFEDATFNAAIVGFGLRNVADPACGLAELARVVKPGGRVVVLEFSTPTTPWFAKIFELYSKTVMPVLGRIISGQQEAYTYLPESVKQWRSRDQLKAMMIEVGLLQPRIIDLTFGIACIHVGTKP